MKASRRALLLLLCLPVLGWALSDRSGVGAQTTGSASAAQTPAEQEALDLLSQEQMLSARTKAEEALTANPNSLAGHYVLGVVLHEAEGSLARAMYHLGRARELYETTWAASTRPAGAPWEMHRDVLYRIQQLAGEMELYDYQLHVLGYHDYLYDPDLLGQAAWPLMQLGRYDEARSFAQRAIDTRDEWQRSVGLNALCAIEGEAGRRQPALEACVAALDNARAAGAEEEQPLAVHAYNAALAARATLNYEQVEQLCLEGARRLEFTPANPWRLLVAQHASGGRLTDAVEALREMQRWRRRQPAYLRDQDRAETDAIFATLMLVAGETEMGLRAVDRAIAQPDRRGLTSGKPEQALGAHALLRRALQRTYAEQTLEQASWSGFASHLAGHFEAASERMSAWPDDERIASVLADDERLVATLRFYVHGGIEPVPSWLVGDLIEILGAGVVAVALHQARAVEGAASPLVPFYDALEAEIALARGDDGRAFNMARSALERLPAPEALLRARIAAVAAQAAPSSAEALAFYEQAMQLDAGVIRRMGLSIPATVRARDGGALASRVADLIESSPRLTSGRGFEVVVGSAGDSAVEACLLSQHGARLACATVDPEQLLREQQDRERERAEAAREGEPSEGDEEEPEEIDPAERLAEEFHRVVFAAPVALDSADLSSLDGRTTTGAEAAREQLRNMLEQTTGGQ